MKIEFHPIHIFVIKYAKVNVIKKKYFVKYIKIRVCNIQEIACSYFIDQLSFV